MSDLISPAYLEQQREMHRLKIYGDSGRKWDLLVAGITRRYSIGSIIDYGCGTGALGQSLRGMGLLVHNYDPGVSIWSALPAEPADLVVCTDVLEHIEPDKLDTVIAHIKSLTKKVLFVVISLRPAGKVLPDGRNAHLIVKGYDYWSNVLEGCGRPFKVKRDWFDVKDEWSALLIPKG